MTSFIHYDVSEVITFDILIFIMVSTILNHILKLIMEV